MIRPFPLLALILSLVALAFYIVALSTSSWLDGYSSDLNTRTGAFEQCQTSKGGLQQCYYIENSCSISSGGGATPTSTTIVNDCNALRTVRAFAVLATIFIGLAALCMYFSMFTRVPFLPTRLASVIMSSLAFVCGLIAWAVFIHIGEESRFSGTRWGYGFGLLTAAWILNAIATVFSFISFPYLPHEYEASQALSGRTGRASLSGENEPTVGSQGSALKRALGWQKGPSGGTQYGGQYGTGTGGYKAEDRSTPFVGGPTSMPATPQAV